MLVITRTEGEVLYIGSEIRVSVVRLASGEVRLGIEAPDDLEITRDEQPQSMQTGRL